MTPTRRAPATSTDARKLLATLFKGKRAKWLPLFQRLLARLAQMPAIEAIPKRGSIALVSAEGRAAQIGNVKVVPEGLLLGLALAKAAIKPGRLKRTTSGPKKVTHCVCLTEPSDIDAELLIWLKAAIAGARKPRRRST